MTDAPAAVVVNYNAGSHLVACIRSLRAEGVERIVVVDNASSDGSVEAAAAADGEIEVVQTGSNLGFGSAANRGADRVAGDVLVMNPDTLMEPGSVKAMAAVLEHDVEVGIVGPRIENPDGSLYPSPRTFPAMGDALGHAFVGLVAPRNRFTRRYRMLDWDHTVVARAQWVSGACMLVRRSCFDALSGFDQRYFMYVEDVDLCWRAHRAGWAVAYEPAARVVHLQGVSSDLVPYRMIAAHHRSLFQFWWKTTSGPGRLALTPLVAGGLALRTVLASLQRLLESVWHR
ncbi:MAG: N-acetylglucosaminyl-diphospho-decaprenol L-rhamnosyltransferase [Actinomycetota bacterium]|jgi:N-acetylglucosaminyl-diphospho-decaprenol L-rhamnosyltransferase|nr:N-acetylglucosaminyl-diphospho-decaprenol L-rhamnosyltransferase [Actinomycetota bacterium]